MRSPHRFRIAVGVFLASAFALLGSAFSASYALTLGAVYLGIFGTALSAVAGDRIASKGLLQRVSRSLVVRPAQGGGYRDAAGTELVVDGESFDAKRVTAVALRIIEGEENDRTVGYVVLDDRVFVLGSSFEDPPVMKDLAAALRAALELPTPASDGSPDPLRGSGLVVVGLLLAELAAMFLVVAAVHDQVSGAAFVGPLAIIVVTLGFAWLCGRAYGPAVRRKADRLSRS